MTAQLTLADNDVLIKGSAYSIWDAVNGSGVLPGPIGVLGAARFVVPGAIERSGRISDREKAMAVWHSLLAEATEMEPTNDEIALATRLENAANELGLALDVGESQLCAMAVHRTVALVLTGDKRAISAAQQLRDVAQELCSLDGRVACLEQLLHAVVAAVGADEIRGLVCAEAAVDTALAICFSCASPSTTTVDDEGLVSYIADLRASAPDLLVARL